MHVPQKLHMLLQDSKVRDREEISAFDLHLALSDKNIVSIPPHGADVSITDYLRENGYHFNRNRQAYTRI